MTLVIGLYVACELIANVTAAKPIVVGPIVVPAGVFVYALSFTLIDLVNERLGKIGARRVIATAFSANLLLAVYAQLTVWWPAPGFFDGDAAFARVLGSTPRIVAASLAAYLVASLLDAEVFAWWRAKIGGYRWLRVFVSNACSTAVDSALFVTLAFLGTLPVLPLIVGQYIVKMAVTVGSLPLIYALHGVGLDEPRRRPAGAVVLGRPPTRGGVLGIAVGLAVWTTLAGAAPAPQGTLPRVAPATAPEGPSAVDRVRPAVVGIRARVPADRPSAATLGTERWGSGVLLDADGLAVTVGYIVLEAARLEVRLDSGFVVGARVVGHDFESGLALIRLDAARAPYPAVRLGQAPVVAPGDPVAIVGAVEGDRTLGLAARVLAVRPFVAYWEYMLERAFRVTPLHPAFGGAALVDQDGALVGLVSLRLPDGHVAIPIDLLAPVREAVVRDGRPARPPRPWLGLRALDEDGAVSVAGVTPGGPAAQAGLRPGDVIVRVAGTRVADVSHFYRRLWAGPVGQDVELSLLRSGVPTTVIVRPRDRYAVFQFRSP